MIESDREGLSDDATDGRSSAESHEVALESTVEPRIPDPAFAAVDDPASLSREHLAQRIDHTLLKTDATPEQVTALLAEARELGAYSICVSPSNLPVVGDAGDVAICTVVGFPSGKHHAGVKAVEAARAAVDGATEIDMVIDIAHLKRDRADLVQQEIEAVRRAAPTPVLLKVIIESAALTDDEIVAACRAAEAAGADYVKTSTGFHGDGGASIEAVRLMRDTVGDRLGVKASGGIRDAAAALAMLEAGASRLGLSGTRAVLDDWGAPAS